MMPSNQERGGTRETISELAAAAAWSLPGRFGLARCLGPSYSLRCLVFHDISFSESAFTSGMGVSITPRSFESALEFVRPYYTPVRLEDVLAARKGRSLPSRAVLLTFDDGYASVMDWAVPLCAKWGVPAIFFLNAAFLDNQRLAPDNLVCFAANTLGMKTVNRAVRVVRGWEGAELNGVGEVFSRFFPSISVADRRAFLEALCHFGGFDEGQLAREARLYLTRNQVRELACSGFELGNHTYSHVRCRSLSSEEFSEEIGRNQRELEAIGGPVRSFSVPYGSSADLTVPLIEHLRRSGHEAAFLSESVANPRMSNQFQVDRVSLRQDRPDRMFFEIEVMPRIRAVRNRLLGRRCVSGDLCSSDAQVGGWSLAENRD
jgi:peptidoglycan/xylan/chitin deacetylase (PgdA/CDA1 family)